MKKILTDEERLERNRKKREYRANNVEKERARWKEYRIVNKEKWIIWYLFEARMFAGYMSPGICKF